MTVCLYLANPAKWNKAHNRCSSAIHIIKNLSTKSTGYSDSNWQIYFDHPVCHWRSKATTDIMTLKVTAGVTALRGEGGGGGGQMVGGSNRSLKSELSPVTESRVGWTLHGLNRNALFPGAPASLTARLSQCLIVGGRRATRSAVRWLKLRWSNTWADRAH